MSRSKKKEGTEITVNQKFGKIYYKTKEKEVLLFNLAENNGELRTLVDEGWFMNLVKKSISNVKTNFISEIAKDFLVENNAKAFVLYRFNTEMGKKEPLCAAIAFDEANPTSKPVAFLKKALHVTNLATCDNEEGKRYATTLIKLILDHAKDNKCDLYISTSIASMLANNAFYFKADMWPSATCWIRIEEDKLNDINYTKTEDMYSLPDNVRAWFSLVSGIISTTINLDKRGIMLKNMHRQLDLEETRSKVMRFMMQSMQPYSEVNTKASHDEKQAAEAHKIASIVCSYLQVSEELQKRTERLQKLHKSTGTSLPDNNNTDDSGRRLSLKRSREDGNEEADHSKKLESDSNNSGRAKYPFSGSLLNGRNVRSNSMASY